MNKYRYTRLLSIELPKKQSAFLWGPRKSGKSTFLKVNFPKSVYIDLLKSETFNRLLVQPQYLREILQDQKTDQPIIIDEVQKIPELLDEVHWLIENTNNQFILCGSSARKLKHGQANLLGGRAWRYEMFGLCYKEVPDFSLLKALNQGLIPSHYDSKNYNRSIRAYIQDYLKEEIKAEGLTRNLPAFSRFIESVSFSHTELVNYSNIASDVGVDSKTVKEYFQILEDTLLGRYLYPLPKSKSKRKDLIKTPKFYFFDNGIINFLKKSPINSFKTPAAGTAFEAFIINEVFAYKEYQEQNFDVYFWQTSSNLEVDLVLGNAQVFIEIKSTDNIKPRDLKGLKAAKTHWPKSKAIIVSREEIKRNIKLDDSLGYIEIYPWQEFLEKLWGNEIGV